MGIGDGPSLGLWVHRMRRPPKPPRRLWAHQRQEDVVDDLGNCAFGGWGASEQELVAVEVRREGGHPGAHLGACITSFGGPFEDGGHHPGADGEYVGLVPLIWLTPDSGYLPLILLATLVEGIGTGLAGPTTLDTALRGVLPADAGAAGAATSAVGQLGSSVGAALFNTVATTFSAGYLATHPSIGLVAATVHGFNAAMVCGVIVLIAGAIVICLCVNAPVPAAKTARR